MCFEMNLHFAKNRIYFHNTLSRKYHPRKVTSVCDNVE